MGLDDHLYAISGRLPDEVTKKALRPRMQMSFRSFKHNKGASFSCYQRQDHAERMRQSEPNVAGSIWPCTYAGLSVKFEPKFQTIELIKLVQA
ncbi:hypothetical protein ASC61_12515 [Aeromicrobium sp. Root344]|nr:hypothetical protein ASC61_12515 [Aeromicrobium sp. Root344]